MLLTQGLGPQPFHNRIVILVNEWTNSAAEMVANFAAENRLATIVGQKTRGNVLGAAKLSRWERLLAPSTRLRLVYVKGPESGRDGRRAGCAAENLT
jgi:hypothetical protein